MSTDQTMGERGQHELLLETVELTKRFPKVMANDKISFSIRKGEVHCLLGENGAGKTTLARCLYGFHQPDGGEIRFRGERITIPSPSHAIRLGIGMVHQHFVLIDPLSVVENVIMGNEGKGVLLNLKDAGRRLEELCGTYGVDLDPLAKIWQLSVGKQQWVEILKVLYVGADLLILDEPTAVLTPQESDRLFAVLRRMRDEGLSIIFVTHKLHEVMEVSDRVTVLRDGRKVDTVNTADVTPRALARMMVGREVIFQVAREDIARGKPVLEVEDLRAMGDMGVEALQGLSFQLHRHEILGLAGVAGNGQRELFEVLIGVRKAKSGSVRVEGQDITNHAASDIMYKGIGHIPEDRIRDGLVPQMSVAENLLLGQQWSPPYRKGVLLDRKEIHRFADRCVSDYSIATPSVDQPTKFLSGGNLQKLILARELWICPQALLANQPTRGLDIGVIEYVHRRLLDKRREGTGILLASEDLEELLALSDRIAVIYRGQIMGIFDRSEASTERIGLLMAGIVDGTEP